MPCRLARPIHEPCLKSSEIMPWIMRCYDKCWSYSAGPPAVMMALMTGSMKAAVLPDPVCAQAARSRPASAMGIAYLCTGVGFLHASVFVKADSQYGSSTCGLPAFVLTQVHMEGGGVQKCSDPGDDLKVMHHGSVNYHVSSREPAGAVCVSESLNHLGFDNSQALSCRATFTSVKQR